MPLITRRTLFGVALTFLEVMPGEAASSIRLVDVPPDLRAWSRTARRKMLAAVPVVLKELGRSGDVSVKAEVAFIERSDFIAFTTADTIVVSSPYIRQNTDDYGMLLHELVHVVQRYPRKTPAWITEGIADYVRYYALERGSSRRHFDPKTETYERGYQPAAALLYWIRRTRKRDIVPALDKAIRAGSYRPSFWTDELGRSPAQLWKDYLRALGS